MRKWGIAATAALLVFAGGVARAEDTPTGTSSSAPDAEPVGSPGPRLGLENVVFSGGDGDRVPEPGETVRAVVILRNDGRDPATGVRARIKVTSDGVSTSNDDLAWADIGPGESARSLSPLTLVIAEDAKRQPGCEDVRIEPAPARDEVPPADKGTVSSDTPVSSDGSTGGGGNVSSGPGSEPGATGGGEPGSTGTEPSIVEPDPGSGTAEPEPLPATAEPVPLPAPGTTEPNPEPADQPAVMTLQLAVNAAGYETSLEYSNQIFCALEGGEVQDAKPVGARDETNQNSAGGTALPVALILVAAATAVAARRRLVR